MRKMSYLIAVLLAFSSAVYADDNNPIKEAEKLLKKLPHPPLPSELPMPPLPPTPGAVSVPLPVPPPVVAPRYEDDDEGEHHHHHHDNGRHNGERRHHHEED